MGKARVNRVAWSFALGALLATGHAEAAGASRFASYETEPDCVAARTLAPAVCRTAFANARTEYEAKTPSFPSASLCGRRYGACMAWPPGGGTGATTFRPRWDGVDIVDTPGDHSVTPAPGSTGRAIRFAARPLAETAPPLVIRGAAAPVPPLRAGLPAAGRSRPAPAVADRAAPPPPGSGFKMEDGVLTYPAPARFQPRNLPKP